MHKNLCFSRPIVFKIKQKKKKIKQCLASSKPIPKTILYPYLKKLHLKNCPLDFAKVMHLGIKRKKRNTYDLVKYYFWVKKPSHHTILFFKNSNLRPGDSVTFFFFTATLAICQILWVMEWQPVCWKRKCESVQPSFYMSVLAAGTNMLKLITGSVYWLSPEWQQSRRHTSHFPSHLRSG